MMEIEDYIVISEDEKADLANKIKHFSKKGYVLEGFSTTMDDNTYPEFHQVMVKYKEKKKDSL